MPNFPMFTRLLGCLLLVASLGTGCEGDLGGDSVPDVRTDDVPESEDTSSDVFGDEDVLDAAMDVNDEDVPPPPPPPPPGSLDCASITGVLLCEDFESGTIRSNIWTKSTKNGGLVDVSSVKVKQGTHALRVTLPATQGAKAYLEVRNIFPVASNHIFGRVYFYITPEVVGVHNEAIYGEGPLNYNGTQGDARYRLSTSGNADKFGSRYNHPYIHDHGGLKKGSYPIAENQWMCIEWEYDGPHNGMRYWFNGTEATTMTVTGSEDPVWKAPSFRMFALGYQTVQVGEQPSYVYYDALVLDTERIGCGAP